jgi:hypothetical protein
MLLANYSDGDRIRVSDFQDTLRERGNSIARTTAAG